MGLGVGLFSSTVLGLSGPTLMIWQLMSFCSGKFPQISSLMIASLPFSSVVFLFGTFIILMLNFWNCPLMFLMSLSFLSYIFYLLVCLLYFLGKFNQLYLPIFLLMFLFLLPWFYLSRHNCFCCYSLDVPLYSILFLFYECYIFSYFSKTINNGLFWTLSFLCITYFL